MKRKHRKSLERATRRRAWLMLVVVLLALVGVALAFAGAAQAQESVVTYTFTTKALEKYLGANGAVFHPQECLQSDLFVSLPHGFYADLWASGAEGSWWSNFGHEVDFTVGKSGAGYDVGIAYFAVVEILPADVVQVYAKFARELDRGVGLYVWLESYLPTSGDNPARGNMVRAGATHTWAHGRWSGSEQLGAFYDTGTFGFAEGTLAEWNASLLFAVNAELSLGATARCASPIALSFNDGREADCTAGVISKF